MCNNENRDSHQKRGKRLFEIYLSFLWSFKTILVISNQFKPDLVDTVQIAKMGLNPKLPSDYSHSDSDMTEMI